MFQICLQSPSVAFLSSSLNATPDSVHMFCLFKNTCFLLSFPRALSLILSLSPSFLPAHFLPSWPLLYSHFHTISLALFGTLVIFLAVFSRQRRIWNDCFVFMAEWEPREKERRGEGKEGFLFGVCGSWRQILDFCVLTVSSLCVWERRRDRRKGCQRARRRYENVRSDQSSLKVSIKYYLMCFQIKSRRVFPHWQTFWQVVHTGLRWFWKST